MYTSQVPTKRFHFGMLVRKLKKQMTCPRSHGSSESSPPKVQFLTRAVCLEIKKVRRWVVVLEADTRSCREVCLFVGNGCEVQSVGLLKWSESFAKASSLMLCQNRKDHFSLDIYPLFWGILNDNTSFPRSIFKG